MLSNFLQPESILKEVGISPEATVVDLGAGSGHYSLAAARMARGGKVYALEVQKDLVHKLERDAERDHLKNISVMWADIETMGGTKLDDETADLAIVSNVLFQVENKSTFSKEVFRILKPQGRVLIVDWSDSDAGFGPKAGHVVSEDSAKTLFENVGLKFARKVSAGAHHYGMIMEK